MGRFPGFGVISPFLTLGEGSPSGCSVGPPRTGPAPVLAPPRAGAPLSRQTPGGAAPPRRAHVPRGHLSPGRTLSPPLGEPGAPVRARVPGLEDREGATWVCAAALRTERSGRRAEGAL